MAAYSPLAQKLLAQTIEREEEERGPATEESGCGDRASELEAIIREAHDQLAGTVGWMAEDDRSLNRARNALLRAKCSGPHRSAVGLDWGHEIRSAFRSANFQRYGD